MRPPKALIRAMGRVQAAIYRRSGGRRLASFRGARVLLLTTVGRRTGRERTAPLLYVRDGDSYVIVGSQGGHDTHPAWVHNLRAEPRATIQVGEATIPVVATEATTEDMTRLWPALVAMYPAYADYRTRTNRTFRVFLLTPERG